MRVYLEAYGCSQNLGEAAELARRSAAHGHAVVETPEGADVGVLVSCGVIGPTEERMVRRWRALGEQLPRLVVTGCLVPLRNDRFVGPARARTEFLPIREQHRLPELLGPEPPQPAPAAADGTSTVPPAVIEEVTLAQGCTSRCSYCFSRLSRGPLASVPLPELVDRVRAAVLRGAREIRLSSLDTSCWGAERPGGPRLPALLAALERIGGPYAVRVGMMSPQSLAPIAEEYFTRLARGRGFRFVHLPVQSGSDRVLAEMRRGYDVAQVRRCVAAARAAMPDVLLATDVIVGYPTETEEEFDRTVALVEELAPEIVNVTRFSPRPHTPAARGPLLPSGTVKRRSRRLSESRLRTARARLERWIGTESPALTVEGGPHGSTVARLPNYLPVVLQERRPLGRWQTVRVDGARSTYLLGRPLTAPDAAETPPGPGELGRPL